MNKFKLLFCVFFSCSCLSLFAQDLDWLKNSTSNDNATSHSFYCSTQHNDDFYFAGDFWKDLTIDGVNISIGLDDANGFIIRMDETGASTAFWHFKSDGYVRINKITVNPVSESLIVTGHYEDNLSFNNETWDATISSNGFVMSIHPDGTVDWMQEIAPQNEVSFASGGGLAVDEQGNVFVGYEAFGTLNIGNQAFIFEPETSGAIISKFSVNGDFIIADAWVGLSFEGLIDITDMDVDMDNDLVIVGCASGTMLMADSAYAFSETTTSPFIIKQDNDLNVQWLKTYQSNRCHVRDMYIYEKDLILALQYNNALNVDGEILTGSGSWGDMAILYLDENAEVQWAKNFTLSTNGGISGVYGSSITAWLDQFYIGGMYQGDVLHEGELILDNSPSGPAYQFPFIISLNKDGDLTSVYDFVGSNGISRIKNISANASHLLFGGDFAGGQVSIGDSSVSTINSALFYGALATEVSGVEIIKEDKNLMTVYPTLASDNLNIMTKVKLDKVSLLSSTGVILREYSGETRMVDVSGLAAGVYYLVGDVGGEPVFAGFVKE